MSTRPYGDMPTIAFPLRPGVTITLAGLPHDLSVRDAERIVRWLRVLPIPGESVEVCACERGAADPGYLCPACGEKIPERRRDFTETFFPPGVVS